jgi:hypothetical protein
VVVTSALLAKILVKGTVAGFSDASLERLGGVDRSTGEGRVSHMGFVVTMSVVEGLVTANDGTFT